MMCVNNFIFASCFSRTRNAVIYPVIFAVPGRVVVVFVFSLFFCIRFFSFFQVFFSFFVLSYLSFFVFSTVP